MLLFMEQFPFLKVTISQSNQIRSTKIFKIIVTKGKRSRSHSTPSKSSYRKYQNVTNTYVAYLLLVRTITDQIGRLLLKRKVIPSFWSPPKTCQILPTPKDKFNPIGAKGNLRVPCSGSLVYMDQTGKSVKIGLSEHTHFLRTDLLTESAVAEHHR